MAKFDNATVDRWRQQAEDWLTVRGHTLEGVKTGLDAWAIAHRADITKEAYQDRTVTDGHIQTALEKIFPNAVFKDKKLY